MWDKVPRARSDAAEVEPDENVIIPSIMQECYLNYSTIKRDEQSRLNKLARAGTCGFPHYPTDPLLTLALLAFPINAGSEDRGNTAVGFERVS
jgi:hypothetical protein